MEIGSVGPDGLGFALPCVWFGLLFVQCIKVGGAPVMFSEKCFWCERCLVL